ncbi:hypothetical protein BJI67_13220 [Acidihalobacter aeolianus]|uniref:Tetratricopeptide repeat protein n=2 Tax=Acidihalobacter aeolianus TaxID=2792603 RepID=A0A1D8KA97_9GAMM|nr:hypothetical protein BJI67_13220 [Acidihalobacter aeolianus]
MRSRLFIWASLILAVLLTVFIYWPGVHGGFTLDDYGNIVDNATLHIHNLRIQTLMAAAFSTHSGPLDRPLSMLSFALDEYFWGPGPYSMKATNIFIHAANGLLVFVVATLILNAYRRFRPDLSPSLLAWTAVAIAAAWLLLPINLTAVLYIVQRMTSLSATFALIAIALYLQGRLRMLEGRSGLWLIFLGFLIFAPLSVLAKEDGALIPVYTLILEFTLFGFARADGRRDPRLFVMYLVLLVLPGVLGLIWMWPGIHASFEHSGRLFTMWERLLTEPRVMLLYIAWSLLPNLGVLSLYHDDFPFSTGLLSPPTTLLSMLGIAGLVALAVWQRRQRPLLSLGILWFLGGQLLTGTIFNLELVFEQRNYLPDFGLLLALFSMTLLESPIERLAMARRVLIAGLIALYAGITALRVHEWANPIRFAIISAAAHPHSPRATYGLGRTYANLVDNAQSPMLPLATKALEKAEAVPHTSILPASALLILHAKLKLPLKQQWWQNVDRILAHPPLTPQDINGLTAMVNCSTHGCAFPKKPMIRMFNVAMKHNPGNANLATIYSNYTLNTLHNFPLTYDLMSQAVKLAPDVSQYWVNLAELNIYLGLYKQAEANMAKLRALNRFGHLDDALKSLHARLEKTRAERSAVKNATLVPPPPSKAAANE